MLFPHIEHIDDVLPHISDKPEFIVGRHDDYSYIDYVFSTQTAFDNVYSRECRGLKFDKSGKLVGRSYQKFHNLNENEEYQEHNIDFSQPHVVLDKLDGSMVHTVLLNGDIRLMTRKGFSEVAIKAERFLSKSTRYNGLFSLSAYPLDQFTFTFEYVAPHNQIVIFYHKLKIQMYTLFNVMLRGIKLWDTRLLLEQKYHASLKMTVEGGLEFLVKKDFIRHEII